LRGDLRFRAICGRRLEIGIEREALRRVAGGAEWNATQKLKHADWIVDAGDRGRASRRRRTRFVEPRDARHAVERPFRMTHERPAEARIEDRAEVEARE